MILLDTSVLVYSIDRTAPQHAHSRRVVQLAAAGRLSGVIVPQVLLELYSTVTTRATKVRLMPQQALEAIEGFRRRIGVKSVPDDVLSHLSKVLATHPRTGPDIYDLFLIAQMRSHGIADICTYKGSDFAYPGIRAVDPVDLD